MAQSRRIWNLLLPADLHATLSTDCGQRRLTAAVAAALKHLSQQSAAPPGGRPAAEGTIEITLRLPVPVSDTADRWRARHGLRRQATVEYAILTALEVPS